MNPARKRQKICQGLIIREYAKGKDMGSRSAAHICCYRCSPVKKPQSRICNSGYAKNSGKTVLPLPHSTGHPRSGSIVFLQSLITDRFIWILIPCPYDHRPPADGCALPLVFQRARLTGLRFMGSFLQPFHAQRSLLGDFPAADVGLGMGTGAAAFGAMRAWPSAEGQS